MAEKKERRADRKGSARMRFDANRKRILASQSICGICGQPVDKTLKWPHPLSACVDHIIPINKGGHPFDLSNLQLAHMTCNRDKSDRIQGENADGKVISNRLLPHSMDWLAYKG